MSNSSNSKLKRLVSALFAMVVVGASGLSVYAEIPYDGYNYDYWEKAIDTPVAYEPVASISGAAIGTEKFAVPSDLAVTKSGDVYICDSGNNRIVVMSNEQKLVREIKTFDNDGKKDTFNNPQGIYVVDDGRIFVADTGNFRIVELSKDAKVLTLFESPTGETLPENFIFEPLKVNVDKAGRVYVIAKNIFEGMMMFSADGEYSGYFGTIIVNITLLDKFWRAVATKEQRSKMKLYVPTEFTNMDVDDDGFVYTTDADPESLLSIKKYNPSSKNVIRNINVANNASLPKNKQKTAMVGDLNFPLTGKYKGRSTLVDIDYRGKGIYSALDNRRGRVFTYDEDGNILYIFAGIGTQLGMTKIPVSIECYEEKFYILDQARGEILLYKETEYGALINKAVAMRYDGDESAAVECWGKVLTMDAGCRLANVGIGRSLLAENKNEEAMTYLKKGMDKLNYSVAFKRYRTDTLKAWFPAIVAALVAIIALVIGIKLYKKHKRSERGNDNDNYNDNDNE